MPQKMFYFSRNTLHHLKKLASLQQLRLKKGDNRWE